MSEHGIPMSGPRMRAYFDGRLTQVRWPCKLTDDGKLILRKHRQSVECAIMGKTGPMWSPYGGAPLQAMPVERYQVGAPYGVPGDRLWFRETWGCPSADAPGCTNGRKPQPGDRIVYRANPADDYQWSSRGVSRGGFVWRSSMSMPYWAARAKPLILSVRAERLWEITPYDALMEGIDLPVPIGCEIGPIPEDYGMWSKEKKDDYTRGMARAVYFARGIDMEDYVKAYAALWDSIWGKRGYPWSGNHWVWVYEFPRYEEPK